MAVYSDAELNGFLADFGQAVTVDGSAVTAILRLEYVDANGVEGARPTLVCRATDVAGVSHGAAVAAGGTNYTVQGVETRDDGMSVLMLEESD